MPILAETKTKRVVFIPQTADEIKMSDNFKRLAVQDETTQHDLLVEAIQLLFKKHNLDLGGNPQRQLFSFVEGGLPSKRKAKCGFARCGCDAVASGIFQQTGKEYLLCSAHLRLARDMPKNWLHLQLLKCEGNVL